MHGLLQMGMLASRGTTWQPCRRGGPQGDHQTGVHLVIITPHRCLSFGVLQQTQEMDGNRWNTRNRQRLKLDTANELEKGGGKFWEKRGSTRRRKGQPWLSMFDPASAGSIVTLTMAHACYIV